MTSPTPEERRKEIAEAFADGLDMYEVRKAERDAKTAAEKGKDENGGNDDSGGGKKSISEHILGLF